MSAIPLSECGHADSYDLTTKVNGEDWVSPWAWCPHCGALVRIGELRRLFYFTSFS